MTTNNFIHISHYKNTFLSNFFHLFFKIWIQIKIFHPLRTPQPPPNTSNDLYTHLNYMQLLTSPIQQFTNLPYHSNYYYKQQQRPQ